MLFKPPILWYFVIAVRTRMIIIVAIIISSILYKTTKFLFLVWVKQKTNFWLLVKILVFIHSCYFFITFFIKIWHMWVTATVRYTELWKDLSTSNWNRAQQKCENMPQSLVTYINILGIWNGGKKGNQNHQHYCIFILMDFTIMGENFKLQRIHQ